MYNALNSPSRVRYRRFVLWVNRIIWRLTPKKEKHKVYDEQRRIVVSGIDNGKTSSSDRLKLRRINYRMGTAYPVIVTPEQGRKQYKIARKIMNEMMRKGKQQ